MSAYGRLAAGAVRFGKFPAFQDTGNSSVRVIIDNFPATFGAVALAGGFRKDVGRYFVLGEFQDTVIFYRPSPRRVNPSYSQHNQEITFGVGRWF
jgi:hypothetical protein